MAPTPPHTPRPADAPAERLPWAPPTLTVIDLADKTQTGNFVADDETTYPSSSRYMPTTS